MDSLTQLAFGAACGGAILGNKVGNKAFVWGAVLGTLPDLDVLIPLGGPVDNFVYHRGFSHSLLLLAVLSPFLAWLITTIHPKTKQHYRPWLVLTFIVLQSSVLLDLMNIYGTQVLWPFDTIPKAIPVLFIIDPLFTLPMLAGVLVALFFRRDQSVAYRSNLVGLGLSLVYLMFALGAGVFVKQQVTAKLADQNVRYSQFVSSPAPFTTLLWRVVGIDGDQYFESYYSLFDGETPLRIDYYPRNQILAEGLESHPPVLKLKRFTRGYYMFSVVGDCVAMADLRMGSEPNYVFEFKIAKITEPEPTPMPAKSVSNPKSWHQLIWLWKRIWNPKHRQM